LRIKRIGVTSLTFLYNGFGDSMANVTQWFTWP